jgi:hypothetical protein
MTHVSPGIKARAERREAAEKRAMMRCTRSPDQQLLLLDERPGHAVKERLRLFGQGSTGRFPNKAQ